eukprot:m.50322 g.50322  ORF g.50322 m.50322 type:complete len:1027 (-) comp12893_c0_seq1:261-3341(-)
MGNALAKRAQLGPSGLGSLIGCLDRLAAEHPLLADLPFQAPLTWVSKTLTLDHFNGPLYKTMGQVSSSLATRPDSKAPLFLFDAGRISVSSFKYLALAFQQLPEAKRMAELQVALDANPSPLSQIFGAAFSGQVDMLELQEKLSKEHPERKEHNENVFKLLLLLQSFEVKLLGTSVEQMAKEVRLNIQAVTAEVHLLTNYAGSEPKCCMEDLDWESAYVFSNGLRSPPWRQVHGDLGVIVVKPFDGDRLTVLANVNGYWLIKGSVNGGEMDYEKTSDSYTTLAGLLRAHSKHFNANIDLQEFEYAKRASELADVKTFLASKSDTVRTKSSPNKTSRTTRLADAKRSTNRALQPSKKWANLGFGDNTANLTAKSTGKTVKSATKASSTTASNKKTESRASSASANAENENDQTYFYSDSDDSDIEEEEIEDRRIASSDLPSEYWSIQKLVKYLSGGNETATIIALCSLRDFDLSSETCQFAIRDVGGLDVLINLLETEDVKCKIGSLQILKEISSSHLIKRAMADMNAMRPLVDLLKDDNEQLKCLAAATLANCCRFARNRQEVRRTGGMEKLVDLLRTSSSPTDLEMARCGALALWSCSKSRKNKERILAAGAMPLLARLLMSSESEALLIPAVGILEECASMPEYRKLIREQGIIPFLVNNLKRDNVELKTHSACAIFKCAEDPEPRDLVRQHDGLKALVDCLALTEITELQWGATGAVWKCSVDNPENVAIFSELKAVESLVGLLNSQPEEVLVNIAGALSELANNEKCRKSVRSSGGIEPLIRLLSGTNEALLVNITRAVGKCAQDAENMQQIDRLDGVRLLWSLLKSSHPGVQSSAAWAICPCIENAKDAGEMVRSFVGGLELIIGLLRSDDPEVQASVCAAISKIAKDEENLAVITDHGVVPLLSNLAKTRDDQLRRCLAGVITPCCTWGNNRQAFGEADAVAPLVKYLKSKDAQVHRATTFALHELSKCPENCVTMHEHGVVAPLLDLVGSDDEQVQEAAASCIANIRRLALANEMARYG